MDAQSRRTGLKGKLALAAAAFVAGFACVLGALAEGDLTQQKPIEVRVDLGTAADALAFAPSALEFETGKLYKLVLRNPSKEPHYFSSPGLANRVFTRKVVVTDAEGKPLGEIKGTMREIEVFPGGVAEWWFVPLQTGTIGDLQCGIKGKDGRTHAEQGMVGKIAIK